tara:strand:+ start:121 stop:666 length:546 start_codon:yes stop_codon:yes gene_type:complete
MESDKQVVQNETTPVAEVKEQIVTQDAKKETDSIPYARFADVVSQKKELQGKLEEYEAKAEKQRQAELEKKGEYETLLNETKAKYEDAKIKAEQFDNYVANRKKAILETYTEDEQDILSDLSLEKLEKYHEANQNKTKVVVDKSRGGVSKGTAPTDFHELTPDQKNDPAVWKQYLDNLRRK